MDADTAYSFLTNSTIESHSTDELTRRLQTMPKSTRRDLFRVLVDPLHRCDWLVDVDAAFFRFVSATTTPDHLRFEFESAQTRHSVYMIASFYGLEVDKIDQSTMIFRLPSSPAVLPAPAMSLADFLAVRHAAK
jgi:hypothetical protein